ncbi:zf-HC2 domain-containing protein [Paenibacillus sp. L3-i20]|uniref:anti-sigma factor n=1 Tax=Paenibacillus sp. L3-i20 TaxID=2905833 RepID=UPI001EDCCAFB|nr:zf-HC2 domain-containing protein [Paenibacillus sp. L3-i20]GKU79748.1 hypothetical protein L3i20_v241450 [Paenibacillus sp. L3-i20]
MNCQEVMELMQRQLDDDLSESEREVLLAHTRHCPDCEAMFERMKLLSIELTSLPKVVPSYSLVDAIMPELMRIDLLSEKGSHIAHPARIEESIIPIQSRRAKRNRRFSSWGALGGIIAAGVVAGLFLVTYPPDLGIKDNSSESQFSADMKIASPNGDEQSLSSLSSRSEDPGGDAAAEDVLVEGAKVPSAFIAEKNQIDFNATRGTERGKGLVNEEPSLEGVIGTDQVGTETTSITGTSIDELEVTKKEPNSSDFGIAGVEEFASPDGQFTARVSGHSIIVVTASDGETVKETSRKNGQHSQLSWSEDGSELSYEVHLDRGAIEKYVIKTSNWKEEKATR